MDETHRATAERMRRRIQSAGVSHAAFRQALSIVPSAQRDDWIDCVFGMGPLPDDGPALPRGCVPYLPCAADALVEVVDRAGVESPDVFVDVGSGLGRAALVAHFLTGARTVGLEIQPALVEASRAIARRLEIADFVVLEGDAVEALAEGIEGTVYFLYCPFGGERLERLLSVLERQAHARPIRIACVDLPVLNRSWLEPVGAAETRVAVYRSAFPVRR